MVDKFGSEDQIPLRGFARSLDDLIDVKNFNAVGRKNAMYGFKLNAEGVYEREEINNLGVDPSLYPNELVGLVYENGQWVPCPVHFKWDIDMQLVSDKVIVAENFYTVKKIINSGVMLTSLMPIIHHLNLLNLKFTDTGYFLDSTRDITLEFKSAFQEEQRIIENLSDPGYIIVEGILLKNFDFKPIITSLKIKNTDNTKRRFSIIVSKNSNQVNVQATEGILTDIQNKNFLSLKNIYLSAGNYQIDRIRLSVGKVLNDSIVKYC